MLESLIEFAWILGKSLLVIVPLIAVVAYYPYAERKIIGYIQVRMGPNRVGPLGLGQPIADALKLMFKEVTIPGGADKVLFIMAPILAMGAAIAARGRWFPSTTAGLSPTSMRGCCTSWR